MFVSLCLNLLIETEVGWKKLTGSQVDLARMETEADWQGAIGL